MKRYLFLLAIILFVQLEGIYEASASHTKGRARASFDSSKSDINAISLAITDAGYEVAGQVR